MDDKLTIGALIKRHIKMRGRTVKEVSETLNQKYTTFSGILNRDAVDLTTESQSVCLLSIKCPECKVILESMTTRMCSRSWTTALRTTQTVLRMQEKSSCAFIPICFTFWMFLCQKKTLSESQQSEEKRSIIASLWLLKRIPAGEACNRSQTAEKC